MSSMDSSLLRAYAEHRERERQKPEHGPSPMPGRPAAELGVHAIDPDRAALEAGVHVAEVDRERRQHGEREQGGADEPSSRRPMDDGGEERERRAHDLERPV